MKTFQWILGVMLLTSSTLRAQPVVENWLKEAKVTAPSAQTAGFFKLDPFYKKHVDAMGLPVVGSAKVRDEALLEAGYLIVLMLHERPDITRAMIDNKTRFVVMATDERTTDVPEHGDLKPKEYWDKRARGLGANKARPAVSCGEENLLKCPGDPYAAENILIHEFTHAIHDMGMKTIDKTFDKRLKNVFDDAIKNGLWKGTYAATNHHEYFAEAAQSYFNCNRVNDNDHNDINTREKLEKYDPAVFKLVQEVFKSAQWEYVPPAKRGDQPHLKSMDRKKLPKFEWKKAA